MRIKFFFILSILTSIHIFSQVVDTIKIRSGKSYVFLINIAEYPTQIVGDDLDGEKLELKKNFKENNLEISLIRKHCFIKFESGQGLDMTDLDKPYQATAYWSGKKSDEVELFNNIKHTTEFIAEKIGVEKESSYNLNAKFTKNEINKLLQKNNITNKSVATLNKFLLMYKTPVLTVNEEYWFLQDIPKIKTIKIFVEKNKKKTIYKSFDFNERGNINAETNYNSKGDQKNQRKYIYKKDMLVQIEKKDGKININYDDGKIILSENIGDADETKVYWIENDQLLSKKYILMIDNAFSDQNSIVEEKIEGNCINSISNGKILNKNCSGPYGTFPFTNIYTSYESAAENQGSNYVQQQKFKVEKKSPKIFQKFYSNAQKPNEKDVYKLHSTIYLNENDLISKIDNEKNDLEIEYSYYP